LVFKLLLFCGYWRNISLLIDFLKIPLRKVFQQSDTTKLDYLNYTRSNT
jgi:hypothetical protein